MKIFFSFFLPVPGYYGCYDNKDITPEESTLLSSINMTVNLCRRHCMDTINRYAFLNKGDTCYCANALSENSVGDRLCRKKCKGDGDQVCGGNLTSSVYDGMLRPLIFRDIVLNIPLVFSLNDPYFVRKTSHLKTPSFSSFGPITPSLPKFSSTRCQEKTSKLGIESFDSELDLYQVYTAS